MRIIRFPNTLHNGEIYSISINRTNRLLLTSGNNSTTCVWDVSQLNALNISDTIIQEKVSEIKPLANISIQEHNVRVCLFSPTHENMFVIGNSLGGVYLVNDWNNPSSFTKISEADRDEDNSITDLSWSPDGRLISWSCLNKRLYIYDIALQKLNQLDNDSIIRSLSFDPTNNFLVSLDDYKLVKIYQFQYIDSNYQFKLAYKIPKLINTSTLSSSFKKISWSPEGNYISIPNANKGTTSLISILSKAEQWNNSYSLVGHNFRCEVIKFNPKVYANESADEVNLYSIIATGGSDNALVVWNNTLDKPLFIANDISTKSITDICWDLSGLNLFMASLDGYLTIVNFKQEELGKTMSQDELIRRMCDPLNNPPSFGIEDAIIDGSKGVSLQDIDIEIIDDEDDSQVTSYQTKTKINGTNKIDKKNQDVIDLDEHKDENGNIIPEIIARDSMPYTEATAPKKIIPVPIQSTKTPPVNIITPKITTKNGKKRIQPMLLSTNGSTSTNGAVQESSTQQQSTALEFDTPSYAVSKDYYQSIKRKEEEQEEKENGNATNGVKKRKKELEPIEYIGSVMINPNISNSSTRLSTLKIRLNFQLVSSQNKNLLLNIQNGSGNEYKPSRISLVNNSSSKQIWCDFVPKLIHLVSGGDEGDFWAMSTIDGNLLVYSTGGRRILPPIILGSALSFLECKKNYLMAVTCVGEVFVWDIEAKKSVFSPANITPLLEPSNKLKDDGISRSENITLCSISSTGVPIVTISNGNGYLFDKDMNTWCTISDSWWAFGSHYWDSSKQSNVSQETNKSSNIIALLEQKTNEEIIRKGRGRVFQKMSKIMLMKEGFENLENSVSLTHLENKILCSIKLQEFKEFKNYFISYVRRISEMGLKSKLIEICQELLGPQQQGIYWEPETCGFKKHDLLKEIILICAKNREVQRVLIHFAQEIGIIDEL